MGYSWDHTPYDLGAIACSHLRIYKRALEYAETAVKIRPNDKWLAKNTALIREKINL